MRTRWVGLLSVLAAAVLLLPQTRLLDTKPDGNSREQQVRSEQQEQSAKLAAVDQDKEATAMLCMTECTKDFRRMMAQTTSGSSRAKMVDHMMSSHQHMHYVSWIAGSRSVHKGKLPPTKSGTASSYVTAAAARVKQGGKYESPVFQGDDGSSYMVLGVPDQRSKGMGIVSVVMQDIVKQVEAHQRRNLRLVPYPHEGNYRIESVDPNTNQDIHVQSGEDNGNASHYHVKDVVVKFTQPLSKQDLNKIQYEIRAISTRQLRDHYIFRSQDMDARQLVDYFNEVWKPAYVEPHYLYMTNETAQEQQAIVPNDLLYSEYQWNLPSIETEKGWSRSKGNEQVIVAVLDTGVQQNHPDLQGKLVKGLNIVDSNAEPEDDVGHGTHVAGIIGATVNNGEGVAGVSWYNKIMPIKVLDSSGAGSTYSVAQGIIWAVDNGAKVINMSLGNYAQAEFLHDAIKYAYERDVVLIAASGNDNTERPGYPAAYPEVFAVGATDAKSKRASFSNYGDYIDVAAPGASIASTYPGGQYAALSGTSMASPHVAALAALIRSANPKLTNAEVMDIMRNSAVDLGTPGKDNDFGYGLIDVDRALSAATQSSTSLQNYPEQVKARLNEISRRYMN
ncbi:S8 family peptidase [Paenibacillus sp. GCM10023252]|uniref:S8 family peptidase n=1 Tax=Paenibacillus sp. GCM10023252 TaxID=3252649 RepID=UPI0036091F42